MNLLVKYGMCVGISFIIILAIYIATITSVQDIKTTTTMTTIITTTTSGKNLFGEEIEIKRSYVSQICGGRICPELVDIVESLNHQVIIANPVINRAINNIDIGKLSGDYLPELSDEDSSENNDYSLVAI